MKLPHPVLPFLLALTLWPLWSAAAMDPDAAQATRLGVIEVEAEPDSQPRNAAWGDLPLREVPAAIGVIGREQLDRMQPRSLSELARAEPALGDNYAPIGYYENLAIRGFPLNLGTGYRANGLAMTGEQRIALEDKERTEVLKGPAALQAGAMEPGGLIDFISKRPARVRELRLGTDSHGSRLAALDVGEWLTPEFGLRANLAWEDHHAWVEHADGRRNLYALAADWQPGSRTRLEFDANYQTSAQRSASGYQLLGGSVIPPAADSRRMLGHQPWQEPVSVRSRNLGLRLRHDLSADWTLRAELGHSRSVINDMVAFAYGCFYSAACADGSVPGNYFAPNGDYDIYDYRNPDDTRRGDEARMRIEGSFLTGAIRHHLTLGTQAFERSIDRYHHVNDYVGTANLFDDEVPAFAPSPKTLGPRVRRLDHRQRSAFLLDRAELGEHWQLIAGLRLARVSERTWSKRGEPGHDLRFHRSLPQAALLWRPDAPLVGWASYSEGLSPGHEAPFWTSNDGDILAPRRARQLETGLRWSIDERLETSLAVYRIRLPLQFAQPDDSPAGYTFVEQGRQVHTGLELSATAWLGTALRLDASASWIRARAHDSGSPAHEGHQLVNVPAVRTNLQAQYTLPSNPRWSLEAGWRHASSNPATPDGLVRVPAWHVFDAGLHYRGQWRGQAMDWRLTVDNIGDHFYWRDTGSSQGDSYLFPGTPRLARLSVNLAF